MLLQAFLSTSPKLVKIPRRLRHPDDRHIEVSTDDHCLESRENLLVCQIPGGPEENKCIRFEILHFHPPILMLVCVPLFFLMSSKLLAHKGSGLIRRMFGSVA